jgi:acyl-CoA reductase-like NAD-dependent aldehyde dehydrogenase
MQEAGVPDGAVNILPGLGTVTGDALTRHRDVNKISFTGSPRVGRQIAVIAAESNTAVTLELGGKSPQVILPSADVGAAIQGAAAGLFTYGGQTCAAGTRVLVHRSLYDQVIDGLAGAARSQVLGDPFDDATTMGALVNARQKATVLGYIDTGRAEGAEVVAGGSGLDRSGYFVEPTIFAGGNDMRIAQEEIFGPVGIVVPFDSTDEAIELANNTQYGLSATLWTRDVSEAHALPGRLRAGAVAVNGWSPLDPAMPWGGVKSSGPGRELGWSGIEANTEEKAVTIIL